MYAMIKIYDTVEGEYRDDMAVMHGGHFLIVNVAVTRDLDKSPRPIDAFAIDNSDGRFRLEISQGGDDD
jgi:hypothetical protein